MIPSASWGVGFIIRIYHDAGHMNVKMHLSVQSNSYLTRTLFSQAVLTGYS